MASTTKTGPNLAHMSKANSTYPPSGQQKSSLIAQIYKQVEDTTEEQDASAVPFAVPKQHFSLNQALKSLQRPVNSAGVRAHETIVETLSEKSKRWKPRISFGKSQEIEQDISVNSEPSKKVFTPPFEPNTMCLDDIEDNRTAKELNYRETLTASKPLVWEVDIGDMVSPAKVKPGFRKGDLMPFTPRQPYICHD